MAYADEVLADTPLIYWKVDEASGNFVDTMGLAADATTNGDAYDYQQPAAIGAGYSIYNDTTSRASTNTDFSFTDANVWTAEAWVKTSGTTATDGMGVIELGVNSIEVRVVRNADGGYVMLVKSFIAVDGQSTVAVNDNAWHHVVVRRTGGVSTIWIDGANASGTMANPTYVNNTSNTGFGAMWHGSTTTPASPYTDSYFLGGLDEIAIYDHALSNARILAHYQTGSEELDTVDVLAFSHGMGMGNW